MAMYTLWCNDSTSQVKFYQKICFQILSGLRRIWFGRYLLDFKNLRLSKADSCPKIHESILFYVYLAMTT